MVMVRVGLLDHVCQHLPELELLEWNILDGSLDVEEVVDHLASESPAFIVLHQNQAVST